MISLAVELGRALTGEALPLEDRGELPEQLAQLGWSAQRIGQLREQRQRLHLPWPFVADLERRRELGFARFDAALATLRAQLGLDGLTAARPSQRPPGEAERRLTAERPPHW